MASNWARFWAVDLHVHTPASGDAKDEDFGTAADVVQKALDAGLNAIAVTDHNTVAWCALMAEAAESTDLVVLPGFELSTPQGHLLGIWEEGTAPSTIEDVLIRVGIERARLGDMDVVAGRSMSECAAEIQAKGGVAIAAHIDKERGILTQPVQAHVNQLLADPRHRSVRVRARRNPGQSRRETRRDPAPGSAPGLRRLRRGAESALRDRDRDPPHVDQGC